MNQVHRPPAAQVRTRGLFLNTTKAKCSIYQSGRMVYDNIKHLKEFALDYLELSDIDAALFNDTMRLQYPDGSAVAPAESEASQYDFIVFNYHPATMAPYLSAAQIRQLPMKCFSVVLEIDPGNAYAQIPADVFDGLIVLDPTIAGDERVWPFPRPLEGEPRHPSPTRASVPRIGSFGFGTPGKGFDLLVSAVNLEFDAATIRINIPPSSYADDVMATMHRRPYSEYLGDVCRRAAKPGIKVEITHDFMSETELVDWCEENDINCFMYTRRQAGLSATTDQAIIAGRPLLISANDTFRHIHPYIPPYPRNTLRDALATTVPAVRRMQQDWSARAFGQQFLEMLRAFEVCPAADDQTVTEILKPPSLRRSRVLVGIPGRAAERTIRDWEERVLQALRKSVLVEIEVVTFARLAEIEVAAFWSGCDHVLILDETADPTVERIRTGGSPTAFRQGKPLLACRHIGRRSSVDPTSAQPRAAEWVELGPIVPFYTTLFQLAGDRPVIGCYGFETFGSNFADVVAKAQRELGAAYIRLHLTTALSPEAKAILDRRLAFLRSQLLPTPGVTIAVMDPIADVGTTMAILGQYSANIFSNAGTDRIAVQNMIDLAMAVDRVVCHTQAAPMPGYAGVLPTLEGKFFGEMFQSGVAAQAAAYNRFSEGRVLLALENALTVDLEPQVKARARATRPTMSGPVAVLPVSALIVEPNGLIAQDSQTGVGTAIAQMRTQYPTVDDAYRTGTLSQQGYLLRAIQSLHASGQAEELLLIGDRHRKCAVVLEELGYPFDHAELIDTCALAGRTYAAIAFVNAISGADELRAAMHFAADALAPGGHVLLTFFFGEVYNVGQVDGNPDFPLINETELYAALATVSTSLQTVTTPAWRSDAPRLSPQPFSLPSYGTLTLRRLDHGG